MRNMDKETRRKNAKPDKSPTTSVRFSPDDRVIIEKASRIEGLEPSAYIRRCAMVHTREHHPELFEK